MKRYRIAEIFYSLQGEGQWAGTPMLFVRFAGCNLSCPFCDTDHSVQEEMTLESLMGKISGHSRICFTGGEPLLQYDENLHRELFHRAKQVHIETNGTILPDWWFNWNGLYVTVSPKSNGIPPGLKIADELKLLYPAYDPAVFEGHLPHRMNRFLQPVDGPDGKENIRKTVQYVKDNPFWRLSLQTHKMIGIA